MKKNNTKKKAQQAGFTLIELLAVITIMGILMLIAIPQITRTIENSRRDALMNTATTYASSVKTLFDSDALYCRTSIDADITDKGTIASALEPGKYYVLIKSKDSTSGEDKYATPTGLKSRPTISLLDQGGDSPWGSTELRGWVEIEITGAVESRNRKVNYSIYLQDSAGHAVGSPANPTPIKSLKRSNVLTNATRSDYVNWDVDATGKFKDAVTRACYVQ